MGNVRPATKKLSALPLIKTKQSTPTISYSAIDDMMAIPNPLGGGGTSSGQPMPHTVSWQQDPSVEKVVLVSSPLMIWAHSEFMAGSLKHWPKAEMAWERTAAMVVAMRCMTGGVCKKLCQLIRSQVSSAGLYRMTNVKL